MTDHNKLDDNGFASLKEALKNANKSATKYGDENILKTPVNPDRKIVNTWVLRFIPNTKEPTKSLFAYKLHGWNSTSTGKYVSDTICPSVFGQQNPIDTFLQKEYVALKKKKITDRDHPARQALRPLLAKEYWLANVFVVSDPVNPENNGKVKILRFGNQIKKIFDSAIDSEDHGKAILDLSDEGQNFRLRVVYNSDKKDAFPSYSTSDFRQKSEELPGIGDDENKIQGILDSVHELSSVFKPKTTEELERLLKEHYVDGNTQLNAESARTTAPATSSRVPDSPFEDDEDDVNAPASISPRAAAAKVAPRPATKGKVSTEPADDVEDYLKSIGG